MLTPPDWIVAGNRPVMMAIGDSFLNGMRSLTIHAELARLSIPAEVGRCLAPPPGFAEFVPADYPPQRPVLLDAEALLRRHVRTLLPLTGLAELGLALPAIAAEVRNNARDWIAAQDSTPVPAAPRRFDNLAVAGARLPDLFSVTYGHLSDRWAAMRTKIVGFDDPLDWNGALPLGDPYADDRAFASQPSPTAAERITDNGGAPGWNVGDVHITLNHRHLMNPDGAPGLEGFTALDVVRARRPLVLLVHIGANHGLPDICIGQGDKGARGAARLRRFARLWPACAEALASVDGLGMVLVVVPPLPSQVPALMPPQDVDGHPSVASVPGPGGRLYHSSYVSALTLVPPPVFYDAAQVMDFDAAAQEARDALFHATLQAFTGKPTHVAFVDSAAIIGAHDTKNGMGVPFREPTTGISYDNRCIGDVGVLGHKLRGGICSLDNFHPTTLGYRVVARAVVDAIAAKMPSLVKAQPAIVQAGDELLEDPPWPVLRALSTFWPVEGGTPETAAVEAGATVAGPDILRARKSLRLMSLAAGLR